MRCRHPLQASYSEDGKSVVFSKKLFSKEYLSWQVPCGKCLSCRLEYSRQWAVRCVHEAQMHPQNSFVTLTYDEDHLTSPKLDYTHFQTFMKDLRASLDYAGIEHQIGFFVTGEYGDIGKRPHWHACLFGYDFSVVPKPFKAPVAAYKTDRGDQVWSSDFLTDIWGRGRCDFGSVTFDSAGYCARYAAKKLVHGKDQDHDFHPISKKSSKYAIGKKWLEKFYSDVFDHGRIILPDGSQCGVPRYYEDWYKKNHFDKWLCYIRDVKYPMIAKQVLKKEIETSDYYKSIDARTVGKKWPLTLTERQALILDAKFNQLQEYLKL